MQPFKIKLLYFENIKNMLGFFLVLI